MRSPLVVLTPPSLDPLVTAVEGNTAQVVRFGSERLDLQCREGNAEGDFPLDSLDLRCCEGDAEGDFSLDYG